ncbi:hypothetical protein BGZ46_007774 [Entomortierella lignicola]|nr:hypothetical protein BGZ46_007774 [Entomortierella lignicola]
MGPQRHHLTSQRNLPPHDRSIHKPTSHRNTIAVPPPGTSWESFERPGYQCPPPTIQQLQQQQQQALFSNYPQTMSATTAQTNSASQNIPAIQVTLPNNSHSTPATIIQSTSDIQTSIIPSGATTQSPDITSTTKTEELKSSSPIYVYPPVTKVTTEKISRIMRNNPDFYNSVLHLMNKMGLPPPFPPATPSTESRSKSKLRSKSKMRLKAKSRTKSKTTNESAVLKPLEPSSKTTSSSGSLELSSPTVDEIMSGSDEEHHDLTKHFHSKQSPHKSNFSSNEKKKFKAQVRKIRGQQSKSLETIEAINRETLSTQNKEKYVNTSLPDSFRPTHIMRCVERRWRRYSELATKGAEKSPRALERWSRRLSERMQRALENLRMAQTYNSIQEAEAKLTKARVAHEVGQQNILIIASALNIPLSFTILPSVLSSVLARVPKRRSSYPSHSMQAHLTLLNGHLPHAIDDEERIEVTNLVNMLSSMSAQKASARAEKLAYEAATIAKETKEAMERKRSEATKNATMSFENETSSSPTPSSIDLAEDGNTFAEQNMLWYKSMPLANPKPPESILYKESMFSRKRRPSKWLSSDNGKRKAHTPLYRIKEDDDSEISSREHDCYWMFGEDSDYSSDGEEDDDKKSGVLTWGKKRIRLFKEDDICTPSTAAASDVAGGIAKQAKKHLITAPYDPTNLATVTALTCEALNLHTTRLSSENTYSKLAIMASQRDSFHLIEHY